MTEHIEYGILRIVNGGAPYIVMHYKSATEAIYILRNNFISEHEKKNQLFYVDNDFFDNHYSNMVGQSSFYYYKIVERKITSWEKYKFFENYKEEETEEKSNIIKFPNLA